MIKLFPLCLLIIIAMPLAGCVTPAPVVAEYHPLETRKPATLVKNLDEIAAPPGSPDSLTLEECVHLAFANRRNLVIADRLVDSSLARAREIKAGDYPQLLGEMGWQGRNNDATQFGVGDRSRTSTSLTLNVPIYDFGRTENRAAAQRLRADAAGEEARRLRDAIRLAVSQSYFHVLEAQKQKTVIDQSLIVLEEQLRIARDYYEQGMVARNDVLAVEVQVAERRQHLIRAGNEVRIALARLNRLVGIPVTKATRLADILEVEPWEGALSELFNRAMVQRPDLVALQRQIEAARREYRSAAAEYAPDIRAFGSHSYSSDSALANQSWFTAGIGVSFPFYQGGVRRARLQRLGNEIHDAAARRDELKDDIILDVKDAYLHLTNAAEEIPVARRRIDLADENLQVIRDRYGQGLVTQTDVLAEENRLISARSDFFSALYSYHQAVARLRNVIGGELPDVD